MLRCGLLKNVNFWKDLTSAFTSGITLFFINPQKNLVGLYV